MKIQDARAVVTGGASGLGNAVAQYVVSKGGKVVILDVQEGPAARRRPLLVKTPCSSDVM